MPSKSKVYFFFETPVSINNRKALKDAVEQVFINEKTSLATLNYIFCSDKRILEINQQYLNHDYFTDIITFGLSEKKDPVIGEIYISVDRLRENAIKLNNPFTKELYRVVFHGALHLCGYNDKKREQKIKIREREDFYINLLCK
jgi:probable rRNA maturation factor